jgi:hypothetical protein
MIHDCMTYDQTKISLYYRASEDGSEGPKYVWLCKCGNWIICIILVYTGWLVITKLTQV